jgi:hypothetical protein
VHYYYKSRRDKTRDAILKAKWLRTKESKTKERLDVRSFRVSLHTNCNAIRLKGAGQTRCAIIGSTSESLCSLENEVSAAR